MVLATMPVSLVVIVLFGILVLGIAATLLSMK